MDRIGTNLLAEAKALIALGDKATSSGRDMFSLLVKANTSPDLPEHQRLSDKDVITREWQLNLPCSSSDIEV